MDKSTLNFLDNLKANNQKAWFNENREPYLLAKSDFENFIAEVIKTLARKDKDLRCLTPKDCIFRINRDMRFSRDKTPYKTSFGAHILAGGRKSELSRAGYFIKIETHGSILAGGAHNPPSKWLSQIRENLMEQGKNYRKIINEKTFREIFGDIQGDVLKTFPRGYPKDHSEIAFLKQKSFLATHLLENKLLLGDKLLPHTSDVFAIMRPFIEFLNRQPGS